jgi:putative endonuclease
MCENCRMSLKKVVKNKKVVLDKISKKVYYVYILLLSNGHLYTGYTVDIIKRIRLHYEGKGSKCVRSFIPQKIERVWMSNEKNTALKAESYIKTLSRTEKDDLVENPVYLKNVFRKRGFVIRECAKYRGKKITGGCF